MPLINPDTADLIGQS